MFLKTHLVVMNHDLHLGLGAERAYRVWGDVPFYLPSCLFFLLKKNLNPFQEQHGTAAVSYTRHTSDRTAAAQEDARSNCVLLPFENTNAIWRFPPPRWLGMSGERSDRKSGARPDLRSNAGHKTIT